MRLKKLSSDWTIFRKDLTRFAPLWLGLCAWLAIWGSSLHAAGPGYSSAYEPIAPFFAPLSALVVFGYLCDPVECNMVHSLPIRRGRLFAIHTLAAAVMFLVPVTVFCFATRSDYTVSTGYRLLFTGVEFFFLFSIAVLCMMITGRKIGAALLYIFIQSFTAIAYVIVQQLYLPRLPGVYLGYGYAFLSPTLLVAESAYFLEDHTMQRMDWVFVAVLLAMTLVLLLISLALYRLRKLEHAGDLLAVRRMDPIFAFCSGMTGAAAMYMFAYEVELPGYLTGVAIGYLAYWMLSKKSARIFNLKIIGGLVCLLAGVVGSIYLVSMDPLDRVWYVPEPENVASITLNDGVYSSHDYETSDPAVIAQLEQLHMDLAEHHIAIDGSARESYDGNWIMLTYELKNGKHIQRYYCCMDDALQDRAEWFMSQPVALFGKDDPNFNIARVKHNFDNVKFDPDLTEELISLVMEASREGKLYTFDTNSLWDIELENANKGGVFRVDIPKEATEIIAWLEANCTNYN